ncbi:putative secreted protein (Por secretion system target) [Mucilaginibacter yixingensis]|uniref:Putative secreted protein (Por secretion system target) n=1 Tax=Mucilaginibacter yixingensis TaxID=1295612 RepID=A0A2T5J5Z6_9SPHI|nr:Ig-like domain-containing protein [Mucilaginibacter yixingensis]PTQ93958.1 putative secreted protein (Por secretion system target) [Mucilaginibacter yixingensis]
MRRQLLITFILLLAGFNLLKAQSQYRSPGTGATVDLGSATNWQVSTDGGATWNAATTAPTGLASGSTITIQTGDTWANNIVATSIPAGVTLTNNSTLLGTFNTTNKLTVGGTLVYAGTAAQLLPPVAGIAGGIITNLTVNNTAGVSPNGSFTYITGVLNLIAGNYNCNNAGVTFYYKGAMTGTNGKINCTSFFFPSLAGQVIDGNLLLNNTIVKLSGQATNFSSTNPIKVTNTLSLAAGTFTLGGTLNISGTTLSAAAGAGGINAGNNTVTFSGTAVQAIPTGFFTANNINNLTISNTAGVTSAGSLNIGTAYTVVPLKAGVTPLAVTGTATIGGTLTIGSFSSTPVAGQQFTILSGTALSGTFNNLVLPGGYTGTLAYSGTDVKLTVMPVASSNATLIALTTTAGALSPSFDANTTGYAANVPNATSSITITPTAHDASASIKVNGTAVTSGNASPAISLSPGNNTINIIVTAQDGVTTKTYTLAVTRQPILYTFDSGVPTNFAATGSTLSSSTTHIKSGSSLAWSVTNGAVLTASSLGITSAQTGNFTTSAAQFYIYNAVPSQDTLVFSFYTNGNPTPQRVGHMLLNYAGWRDYHRSYRFDYNSGLDMGPGGFTLDKMIITYKAANSSSTPTIYLDEFNMVGDANERQPGPHMQLDLNQFSDSYSFLEPLQYFLNPPPAGPAPTATAQEQANAATVKAQYPRSIFIPNGANVTTAENYVTGCGIYRNADGSINGTRGLMYLNNVDTLVKISNYVGYLTAAASRNNDNVAKSNLLLFTEYLLDQGLAEGGRNNIHTNDYTNCRNFPVGFLQAVKSGLLTDSLNKGILRMLKWSNGYNVIYNPNATWVETDFIYLKATFLLELAGYAPSVDEQVRDYYNASNFLSLFTNTQQGIEDGIKPDGTGFHHNFNNIHYLYAWGVYADRANSLKGTVFRIKQQAFNNMAGAFKTILLQQSPNAALIPNSLGGRYPLAPFTQISQNQLKEMVAVGGDIEGTTNDTGLAQLYNYIYQTNNYNVPARNYDSVYCYNYASIGIKRKGNWIAAMKGLTNTLRGGEIFPSQKMNMYGRYQSYGALEVLYSGGNTANGWILNGAGWDWNMYPGTTSVQLPWASLKPSSTSNVYQVQANNFAGALSLGAKHGIFAIDFVENANGNFTPDNLKFKKSVFTFDSLMVCLGSSISSTNSSNITSTNLFQAIDTAANFAPIYVNSASPINGATYSNTLSTSANSAWMVNGQTTGYYIPKNGGTITVARGSQSTPDQSDLNQTLFNTANYSKAHISHGNAPTNGTYQYVVVPATTPAAMQTLASTLDAGNIYTVLSQTDSLHAVFYKPDSLTSYAFFQPNDHVNIGYIKSISNKGLVGIQKKGDTLTVTINNPDLNAVADNTDAQWHSSPQNINLILNGNWTVIANTPGVSTSSANNTLTAGFTLKDGFSGSLTLVVSKPPVVALTAPAKDTTVAVGTNMVVNANASSPNQGGSIAKVDFYNGSTLLGTSTASPFTYTWNNLAAGTDTLKAVATDNIGLTTTSSKVVVTVSTPPVVAITAPAGNATVASGSDIVITVNASSPNTGGSIAKVDFYNGSTLLGTSTTAPYSYTLTNVSAGTDSLKAVATDDRGLTTTSSAIIVTISNPPVVSLTAPVNNNTVLKGSNVIITADASNSNTGGNITKVDFYNGSTLLGTSTTAPYSYTLNNVAVGTDTLKAVATDDKGLTTTSANVILNVADAPVVVLTAPADNSTVTAGDNVTLTANASSPNTGGSIAKVDFYNGSALIGTATAAPFSYAWNSVAAGTDTLKAVATDNYGFATTSASIRLIVNQPPTVAATSPMANTSYFAPASVTINANAADADGSIQKVEFFQGATKLGEALTAPYSFNWTNVPAGSYAITARATDNKGAVTTSAVVNSTVTTRPVLQVAIPDMYALNAATDLKNTIYIGYGPSSFTLTPSVQGGQGGYTYSWSNGATTSSIVVSAAGTYTVNVSSADGGLGTATITINTLDVRCGNDNTKVQVCHNQHVICVAQAAVQEHLSHGDKLGSCSGNMADAHTSNLANDLTALVSTSNVAVYPNPVADILHIAVPQVQPNASIHLYSYSSPGKEVRTFNLTQAKQDVTFQGLAPGYYFLVIKNGSQIIKKTLIKN